MSETNSNPPLYTLNPLVGVGDSLPLGTASRPENRFSDRAADYVKYRPSYPAATIDTILDGLGMEPIAADIGAGTGISARLLAERNVRVWAIEPNVAMRSAAAPHPLVEFRSGIAEATRLEAASVDLVTCFQAFHWFVPEPTLREFQRILKSTTATGNPGRLALVWNNRDKADAFTTEYSELTLAASTNRAIHDRVESARSLLVSPHFTNVRIYTFANCQALDLAGLMGRVRSNSYTPHTGELLQQLMSDLEQLHDRWQDDRGLVYLNYVTSVHLAEPVAM